MEWRQKYIRKYTGAMVILIIVCDFNDLLNRLTFFDFEMIKINVDKLFFTVVYIYCF